MLVACGTGTGTRTSTTHGVYGYTPKLVLEYIKSVLWTACNGALGGLFPESFVPVVQWNARNATFSGSLPGLGDDIIRQNKFQTLVRKVGRDHGVDFRISDSSGTVTVHLQDAVLYAYLSVFIESVKDPHCQIKLPSRICGSDAGIIGWSDSTRLVAKLILMRSSPDIVRKAMQASGTSFIPQILKSAVAAAVAAVAAVTYDRRRRLYTHPPAAIEYKP